MRNSSPPPIPFTLEITSSQGVCVVDIYRTCHFRCFYTEYPAHHFIVYAGWSTKNQPVHVDKPTRRAGFFMVLTIYFLGHPGEREL